MSQAKPKKKGFKMPHLLFLMLLLLLFMVVMTYLIPAGQFAKDEKGTLIGDQFNFLPAQTPVNPWQALNMILTGGMNSSMVMTSLLFSGGAIGVILATNAIDEMINFGIYKLQDKGIIVLLPLLFIMMGYLGAFGGGDSMVAIVPVGVVFAKKMRLDPIMAVGVTLFPLMIGFATGPTKLMIPQLMMDLPVYSGFGMRFATLTVCVLVGCLFAVRYALKLAKDPSKSAMGNTDWVSDLEVIDESAIKVVQFNWKYALITALFFGQYILTVTLMTGFGFTNTVMIAVQLPTCIFCGLLSGMNMDTIGKTFARGSGGMAFVGVVIGLAGTMSLIMNTGNILHTIVYYATLPLKGLAKGFSAIGISIVIMIVNVFIPSASSKAAILFPIVRPMSEALGLSPQVAVSAFQFGDGFTNMITPALGWTVGSLEIAQVPFDKWLKWALPAVVVLSVICWIWLYFLSMADWTGL